MHQLTTPLQKQPLSHFQKILHVRLPTQSESTYLPRGMCIFQGGSWDKKIHEDPVKIELMIKDSIPMKRFGTPKEIADAVVFLCSNRASFITGSVLVVDGGQTVGIY